MILSSIGMIGGADGPTAIFVSGDPALTVWIPGAVLIAVIGFFLLRRKKR